jgi:hypothetical protein
MENIAAITIEFMGFTHQLITVPHPVDIGPLKNMVSEYLDHP